MKNNKLASFYVNSYKIEKLESLVKNSVEEIDTMVYELYGLSSDEVKIVEGNV